ncbi:MAG: prepilin-type N-terminal cleavage/methylation domain-containing protein [Vulcanimicrobiota bacterium]
MRMFRGFTLLEMIISMILLMLILFSIGILIPYSQVRMNKTAHRDIAVLLAENMIENIRTLYYDNVMTGTFNGVEGDSAIDCNGSQAFPPLPYPREEYQYLVEGNPHRIVYSYIVTASEINPDNKKVSVSVYWMEDVSKANPDPAEMMKSITLNGGIYRR